jgi:hypothetical protein
VRQRRKGSGLEGKERHKLKNRQHYRDAEDWKELPPPRKPSYLVGQA